MDKEKADFSFLKIVGTETSSGVCGPDGCSIEEHRKQVAMEKQKATENKQDEDNVMEQAVVTLFLLITLFIASRK